MKRGFCGIGIFNPEKQCNIGTLFRSALALHVDYIFTIGRKYHLQSSDTCKSIRNLPYFHFLTKEEFFNNIPACARLVCIETKQPNSRELSRFVHPEQAVYLLGNEGNGIPPSILEKNMVVHIPSSLCLNVSVSGSIVLYDRLCKMKGGNYE